MVLRARNIALPGSLALLAGVILLLAPPVAGTARANACKSYGDVMPLQITHRQARKAIRCLLNRARDNRGLGPLDRQRRLQRAAQDHTDYMDRHGCFSHQCPGELTLLSRLGQVGYIVGGLTSWACGENIAWGGSELGTPKAIFHAWMHSPDHKRNILDPRFRDLGVGFARGMPPSPKGNGGTYTTDFGVRSG